MYRTLIGFTVALTLVLIMAGAWVRLTDAGLGCPDWPGCYGKLTPSMAKEEIARAVAEQGGEHGPVSMGKAWREMIHRYIAKVLGLLIIAIAVIAWRRRHVIRQSPALPIALVGVVVFQGLLGMWTVTLLLKPAIVTLHLLGGLTTFALLWWLYLRQTSPPRLLDPEPAAALRWPSLLAVPILAAQIFLGGWTSTNYAALACTDLPTCQGAWWPDMDWSHAFDFVRKLGMTVDGQAIPFQSLTAIHMTNRLGALVVSAYFLWLAWRALRTPGLAAVGATLLAALALQVTLGVSNVVYSLPLPVAVAHTGGAAALLAVTLLLHFRASRARLQV